MTYMLLSNSHEAERCDCQWNPVVLGCRYFWSSSGPAVCLDLKVAAEARCAVSVRPVLMLVQSLISGQ